ncbi:probable Actin cytoskeleton-regulatory complex protein pan1 [Phialocephala subalpina]|uniref:Actin cytoskeleton-regulatory complex protein PAN1 n=1 Tax=Phialocephala subalpina TaxID=576137 RepID=A0A1L7XUI4_9HELO|nr:probable Actin cytoskeleton-regulatory complex protein pan1 [Phialocephala subalpina]
MFSGSNSYLGGQSGRPGGPQQYGSFQSQQPPPQQQNFLGPQPTGYGQAPLQQQYTGFPMQNQQTGFQPQQMQPQPTGYAGQPSPFNNAQAPQQQNFQTGAPPMPQIPQQYQQQTQQQAQPPPAAPVKPQPTGFAAMADSFKTTPSAAPARGRRASKSKGARIPNIRLSFITAQDQAKFETLFKSAVGDGQTLSGDKSRDLLLRSKLDGNSLSQIWTLADTTRSGQLHFPEFALAMYLCNLKLVGKQLPATLPENIKNEVTSMVDIINFGAVDDGPEPAPRTNAPDFNIRSNAASPPTIQQPQPMASNSSLLQAQMTGFPGQQNNFSQGGFQAQPTGFQQPMQTGFGQQGGMQPQQTGFQNPGANGYNGPRPPMPPMPTGYGNQGLSPAQTGMGGMVAPLNSQPTGRPGQWGLVNAPATGLPNIDLLQSRMMPQQGREQGIFTTAGLSGNAVIPWAVTKDEKTRYDSVFKAWDGFGKGFIGGDVAIEVFGQSGLEKPDLERVWTLADHGNKGRLNMDEFAVAMHLIYRKLNGYPLPAQLPPELVPPSTRNFSESIGTVKSLLSQESDFRKNSGASLLPQKTGVSYLKNHSFRGDSAFGNAGRKDATVFKNNDDDVGYKSSARRRLGGNNSPRPSSPASVGSNDDLSLEQLRKKIREKQVLLDAIDFKDENAADEDDALDRRDRREAEDLYRRIRRIQEDIDSHPDASLRNVDSGAETRILKRQLQGLTDKLPEIASEVRKTERQIADAKLELFRLKDAKAHPGSASSIVGTGPGGSITESDRLKARAKAMMQQRSAALTGRKIESSNEDHDAPKRLEEENVKIKNEKENNERMVRDVEDSVRDFSRGLEDSLKEGSSDSTNEHEKRRWEDGLGVEDEVKDFIFDLQRSSRSARVRTDDRSSRSTRDISRADTPSSRYDSPAKASPPVEAPKPAPAAGGTYAQYKTPEDRAAYIKQQAEQRMAERLAALGIKAPSKPGETTQQRLEREKNERAAKLKQAEEEDAKREAERQARINEEQGIPPPAPAAAPTPPTSRKPPPPPSRKAAKSDASERKAEEEQRVLEEQKAQLLATQELEDDAARQEKELANEREAAAARLRALEEQVKAGKVKKEEEKRRKKAAQAEAKQQEARLAAQRAEIEAAQARERELQRQLEAMDDDDSSDEDDGPEQVTPQASTPTQSSQEFERKEISPPPPPVPAVIPPVPPAATTTSLPPVSSPDAETRNPFYKKLQTGGDTASPSVQSNNPFHRLPSSEAPKAPEPLITQPTGGRSRARPEEDEWSVVGSDKEDDSSDDEGPGAGNARHLASILFGTMGPPRPLSAAGGAGSTPTSPAPPRDSPASPPPPPPMPSGGAPLPPPMPSFGGPPPPPPMPGMGAPGAPPPPPPMPAMSAPAGGRPQGLLSEIQMGKSLKKTQTKDKSQASVAGRVLD